MIDILGVVIADDEKKICRLIEFLIDWETIGVELLGVAYDGISAYQLIQEKKPDILLTDIRMPGMDGLELIGEARKQNPALKCIIISGYKDFKYAQQGMRYGVKDYLLKPINQEELIHSLKKLVKETEEQKNKQVDTVQMEEKIKNYSRELKRVFLKTVLDQDLGETLEEILAQVRKKNAADVINQRSRCVLVKPDINYKNFTKDGHQLLTEKTIEIIKSEYAAEGMGLILETSQEGVFAILSDDKMNHDELLKATNHIRERVIGLRDLFPEINVTIVISKMAETQEELIVQIHRNRITMYNRILSGVNMIVELKQSVREQKKPGGLNDKIRRPLEEIAENLEIDRITDCLEEVKAVVKRETGTTGIDIKFAMKLLIDNFLEKFGKMDSSVNTKEKTAYFEEMFEHCNSIDEVFSLLDKVVTETLLEMQENLKNREIKPIAYAKQYIEEKNGKNIRLEELAKAVGFNYTYFSSLFKKETGMTLTDYIQQVRIEAAKKLLVERERSVTEIAGLVGYNDIKFFTKQFKKTVGVSPNEYHKMFLER